MKTTLIFPFSLLFACVATVDINGSGTELTTDTGTSGNATTTTTDGPTSTTGGETTTGGTTGTTTEAPTTSGETGTTTGGIGAAVNLPVGDSKWSGHLAIGPANADFNLELSNDNGDLAGTATFISNLIEGTFTLTGVYDPHSERIALVPVDWVGPDPGVALVGMSGTYDPATHTITGLTSDTVHEEKNILEGGLVTIKLLAGGDEGTPLGDAGQSLDIGASTFSGTFKCTTSRPVAGALTFSDNGMVEGTLTWAEMDLAAPIGTFAVTGVHNPSTGGLTLIPGLWTDIVSGSYYTFWWDGVYNANDRTFVGDHRNNVPGCIPGVVMVTFP